MDATSATTAAPSFMLPDEPDSAAFSEIAFNEYFGLLSNEDLVIIRPYMDDEDDRVLDELRPKYIILYDPNPAFVRRVEVRISLMSSSSKTDITELNRLTVPHTKDSPCGSISSCTRTQSRSSGTCP